MIPRIHTLAFEADPGYAAAASDPDTGDVTEAADTDTVTVDAPAFDLEALSDDPAFLDLIDRATDARLSSLAERLEQQPADVADTGDVDYDDPLVRLMGQMHNTWERRFEQIQPSVQAFEDQQREQQINEWCEQEPAIKETQEMLVDQDGNPVADASNLVQFAASGYLPDLQGRYGAGDRADRAAIRMAADQVKAATKAAYDSGYRARNAELKGLSTAREPVPAAVEGVQLRDEPETVLAAAEQWARRNGFE